MRMMNGLRSFTVVGAISLLGAGAVRAQTEVTHFKANGATAVHNSFDGTTAYDLSVNRNDSGSSSTTFLSFETQTCNADFSVCTGIFGFGNIPSGDFNASGGTAGLNTNLATNSGFTVFNYVQDANGFNTTPGFGGIIIINWKKIPRQSSSMTGTQTFVSGGFSNKLTGSQSNDSATSTGTFLGVSLPTNGSGFIGLTKSSQIIIFRN